MVRQSDKEKEPDKEKSNVVGIPVLLGKEPRNKPCPTCGGKTVFSIGISINEPNLPGGGGQGVYLSCAACDFNTPCVDFSIWKKKAGVAKNPGHDAEFSDN